MPSYRERLVRFYERYNPSCIASVDAILSTYDGREEDLIRVLVKKYGPEPDTTTNTATTSAAPSPRTASPAAAADGYQPPHLAASRSASAQAHPAPTQQPQQHVSNQDLYALQRRVKRMLARYEPSHPAAASADALSEHDAVALLETLVRRHGPEPPALGDAVHWQRVIEDFMQERCPHELSKTPALLKTFHNREFEVMEALQRRYPHPAPQQHQPRAAAAPAARPSQQRDPAERAALRERVVRFYEAYNPEKLGTVDRILDAFHGTPAELMAQLVEKYGPEPVPMSPPAAPVPAPAPPQPQPHLNADVEMHSARSSRQPSQNASRNASRRQSPVRTSAELQQYQQQNAPQATQYLAAPSGYGTSSASGPRPLPGSRTDTPVGSYAASHDDDVAAAPAPYAASHHVEAPVVPIPQQPLQQQQQHGAQHHRHAASPAPSAHHQHHGTTQLTNEQHAAVVDAITSELQAPPQHDPHVAHAAPTAASQQRQRSQHQQQHHSASSLDWDTRFFNYYAFYRPDKLLDLGKKTAAHRGREAQWMSLLLLKYGEEPPVRRGYNAPERDAASVRSRLAELFSRHDPSMLPFVERILNDPTIAKEEFIRSAAMKYGDATAHVEPYHSAPRRAPSLKGLKSPSPDGMGGGASSSSRPVAGGHGSDDNGELTDFAQMVEELSGELDAKTRELADLVERHSATVRERDAAVAAQRQLQGRADELSQAVAGTDTEMARLRELAKNNATRASRASELAEENEKIRQQVATITEELAHASSTVAVREHQNRVLRMQMRQLSEEASLKEGKIATLMQANQDAADSLAERLKDLAALQLDQTPSSEPEKFYSIVEDIQEAFRTHYDERIRTDEGEMREYYAYAEKQIANREAIIDELLDAFAKAANPPAAQQQDHRRVGADDELDALEPGHEPTLEEEVARLRTQLALQREEHSALVQAVSLRESAAKLPPPQVHVVSDAAERHHVTTSADIQRENAAVRELKRQMEEQKAEARAAQAALSAELNRQVAEMRAMHERIAQADNEAKGGEKQLQDLAEEVEYWRTRAANSTGDGAYNAATSSAHPSPAAVGGGRSASGGARATNEGLHGLRDVSYFEHAAAATPSHGHQPLGTQRGASPPDERERHHVAPASHAVTPKTATMWSLMFDKNNEAALEAAHRDGPPPGVSADNPPPRL